MTWKVKKLPDSFPAICEDPLVSCETPENIALDNWKKWMKMHSFDLFRHPFHQFCHLCILSPHVYLHPYFISLYLKWNLSRFTTEVKAFYHYCSCKQGSYGIVVWPIAYSPVLFSNFYWSLQSVRHSIAWASKILMVLELGVFTSLLFLLSL